MARQYDGPARYPLQTAIGNGAYGNVYRARDRESGATVALKQVRIRRSDNGCPANLLREVAALKRLAAIGHENLVRLLDVCYVRETSNLFLVFEHLDIDLLTYLHEPTKVQFTSALDPAQAFRQLLLGLSHLHSHALLHRDIKPANILLSKPHGHVKLADFGLTRVYTLACCLTSVVVTLWYRAPEIIIRTDYGTPIDIWSCGCVLAEMFMQKMPLFASESDSDVAQLKAIFSTVGLPNRDEWPADAVVPWESFSSWFLSTPMANGASLEPPDDDDDSGPSSNFDLPNLTRRLSAILPSSTPLSAVDLIARMLSFDPSRRLAVYEALSHPFVADVSTYHGRDCSSCSQPVFTSNDELKENNSAVEMVEAKGEGEEVKKMDTVSVEEKLDDCENGDVNNGLSPRGRKRKVSDDDNYSENNSIKREHLA